MITYVIGLCTQKRFVWMLCCDAVTEVVQIALSTLCWFGPLYVLIL